MLRATVEVGTVDAFNVTKIMDPAAVEPWDVSIGSGAALVTNYVSDNMTVINPLGGSTTFGRSASSASMRIEQLLRIRFSSPLLLSLNVYSLSHQTQRGNGFLHFAVTAVDACDVTATAVASQQNDPAGQRRFENAQDVVAVQPKLLSTDTLGSDLPLLPALHRFVGAGAATESHPLSADQ